MNRAVRVFRDENDENAATNYVVVEFVLEDEVVKGAIAFDNDCDGKVEALSIPANLPAGHSVHNTGRDLIKEIAEFLRIDIEE